VTRKDIMIVSSDLRQWRIFSSNRTHWAVSS